MRALILALLFPLFLRAEAPSPRFLTHLLGYIALDYSGAVEKAGVVSAPSEYSEMLEFVDSAIKEAAGIPAASNDVVVARGLKELKRRILGKAAPEEVANLAKSLENRVAQVCDVKRIPTSWPSLASGQKKYLQNCAQCHGVTGHGDGPAGGSLDPKPADFQSVRMSKMTPFNIFNAIRLGVPGTAMAAFPFSDEETWDVAFFVSAFHHGESIQSERPAIPLSELSERSDEELAANFSLAQVSSARRYQSSDNEISQFVDIAQDRLREAQSAYQQGDRRRAQKAALAAYLDGVELFERRLRVDNSQFVLDLEMKMAKVRSEIGRPSSVDAVTLAVREAHDTLEATRVLLRRPVAGTVVTLLMALGIVIREAFEAVLILIAFLGVVRSAGSRRATVAVHAGWGVALLIGALLWVFSGWALALSGLQRELLEGGVTLLSVVVLLYFGFWLHRKTEIGRWRNFLSQVSTSLAGGGKLFGLFGISFMAVFREAFETVLFLRALSLESGGANNNWIGVGVASALAIAILITALSLKLSARLPLRQIFVVSSSLLVILAITLTGKSIHSFQEAGVIGVTAFPMLIRVETLGLFPTWETIVSQITIGLVATAGLFLDRLRGCFQTREAHS